MAGFAQIQSHRPGYSLPNVKVIIYENIKGEISVLYNTKFLSFTINYKPFHQAEVANVKSIDPNPYLSSKNLGYTFGEFYLEPSGLTSWNIIILGRKEIPA